MSLNLRIIHSFLWLLLISICSHAQVNITKYAAKGFFEVNPVIDVDEIVTLEEENKDNSLFQVEWNEAFDLWNNGYHHASQEAFIVMKQSYPSVNIIDFYLGQINFELKDYGQSYSYFQKAFQNNTFLYEAKYMMGVVALEMGNHKKAKEIFTELINVNAFEEYGHYGLGQLSLYKNQTVNAYKHFKNCIDSDSLFTSAYPPMIQMDLTFSRTIRAKKVIAKGLKSMPDWQQGIIMNAMIELFENSDYEKFENHIDRLIELDPDNYHYLSIKGFLEIELNNYGKAIEQFRNALNMKVGAKREGEYKFSTILSRNEGFQRVLNYYYENFHMEPEARVFFEKALCSFIINEKSKALHYIDSANQVSQSAAAHFLKGTIYRSDSRFKHNAITSFGKSISLDSANWYAYSYRGEILINLNQLDSAHLDFKEVIRLQPRLKDGYKNLGIILLKKKQSQRAFLQFSKAIVLDESDYDLYFNRALVSSLLGELDYAENDLTHILKSKRRDVESYYFLYQVRMGKGDSLMALAALDSASRFSNRTLKYHEELLSAASGNGEFQLSALNRLISNNANNNSHYLQRGKIHLEYGRFQQASDDFRRFLKEDKKHGEAVYLLGMCLIKKGDHEEGQRYLLNAKKMGYKRAIHQSN